LSLQGVTVFVTVEEVSEISRILAEKSNGASIISGGERNQKSRILWKESSQEESRPQVYQKGENEETENCQQDRTTIRTKSQKKKNIKVENCLD